MSLMPYMKQLEEELVEEDVELLRKKVRKSKDFSKSLEYLSNSLVPLSWPMFWFFTCFVQFLFSYSLLKFLGTQ